MPASRSVKIDSDLWRKIKVIVLARDDGISDYINEVLRPAVERDHPKALKKLNEQQSKDGIR